MTAAETAWIEAVMATKPRVAVFDCDGTLWNSDAGVGFMRWSQAHGLLSRSASEWLDERYREYLAGRVDELTICGEMVQVYDGLAEAGLRRAAVRFFAEEVEPHIFPALEALVARLRDLGTDLWAVSSTCNWVIEAGVRERFGIPPERVLAAEVRVVEGRVTAELVQVPTDEGKTDALRAQGVDAPDAVFGNSMHDLDMLATAGRPWVVNPNEALRAEASARQWSIFDPVAPAVKRVLHP